jgi:cytochrome P450
MQFNPFAPDIRQNPFSSYAELRREAPVYKLEPMGFWLVTRYEDVQFVLKSPQMFSSEGMAGPQGLQDQVRSIITMDPPDHQRLRSLVGRAFTPRMIAELEPRIREITRTLLAKTAHSNEFDVIGGLALPLPVRVIAEMLGVEPRRLHDFKRWSDIMVGQLLRPGASPEEVAYEQAERSAFEQYFRWAIEERRRKPGDDLISALIQAEEQHQHLTAEEVFGFALLLLVAGNETTTNLIGNMVLTLLRHPAALAELSCNPELIPAAVEETLRYESPVQMLFRIAREDIEMHGQRIPKGAMVWPVMGSANRDEARYPDPDRFDIGRDTSGHLAFGHGIHFCIGAPLARLETRVAMEELLPMLANAHLAEQPLEYIDAFFLRGLKRLPLALPERQLAPDMPPSPRELARMTSKLVAASAKDAYRGVRVLLRRARGDSRPA